MGSYKISSKPSPRTLGSFEAPDSPPRSKKLCLVRRGSARTGKGVAKKRRAKKVAIRQARIAAAAAAAAAIAVPAKDAGGASSDIDVDVGVEVDIKVELEIEQESLFRNYGSDMVIDEEPEKENPELPPSQPGAALAKDECILYRDDDDGDVTSELDDAEAQQPPRSLDTLGLSVGQWRRLEKTSRDTVPRFLFRAFHDNDCISDGDSVTPLAFSLVGDMEPTTIYDIPNLPATISSYLFERKISATTAFSAWTADFSQAMASALAAGGSPPPTTFSSSSSIGIIDTTLLPDYARVYHTHDLYLAGLSDFASSAVYLVYGPITGPAYHRVRMADMSEKDVQAVHIRLPLVFDDDGIDAAATAWLSRAAAPKPDGATDELSEKEVVAARNIAALFRRSGDKRPDVIVAVTAAVLCLCRRCRRGASWSGGGGGGFFGDDEHSAPICLNDHNWRVIQAHLAEELRSLRLLPAAATTTTSGVLGLGLTNPKTRTANHPDNPKLRQTMDLLMAIEAKLRDLGETGPGPGQWG